MKLFFWGIFNFQMWLLTYESAMINDCNNVVKLDNADNCQEIRLVTCEKKIGLVGTGQIMRRIRKPCNSQTMQKIWDPHTKEKEKSFN